MTTTNFEKFLMNREFTQLDSRTWNNDTVYVYINLRFEHYTVYTENEQFVFESKLGAMQKIKELI